MDAILHAWDDFAPLAHWIGNFPRVREIAQELGRIEPSPGAPPLSVLSLKWVETCCLRCFQDVSPVRNLQEFQASMAYAERTGVRVWTKGGRRSTPGRSPSHH